MTADIPTVIDADHTARAGQQSAFDGITVRDFFAAHALTGILAAHTGEVSLPSDAKAAAWAYEQADAMLKARSS